LSEPSTDAEVQDEARYNRAKAYLALNHVNSAKEDLEVLAEDVRTEHGAEAKYRLAQIAFDEGKLDQAEEQIMAFAGMNTSHQYWLARAFVLLADVYVARGDDFQAQQYLLSLQQNYRVNDDIQTLCADRMDAIVARSIESTKQQQVEEDDDDEDDDE
jgi:predicted Zn-dependent protease